MKAEILISFAGIHNNQFISYSQGEIIELPEDVNWLTIGFAKLIDIPVNDNKEVIEEIDTPKKPKRVKRTKTNVNI